MKTFNQLIQMTHVFATFKAPLPPHSEVFHEFAEGLSRVLHQRNAELRIRTVTGG